MKLSYQPWSPATGIKSINQQKIFNGMISVAIAMIFVFSGCNESGLTDLSNSPVINSTVPASEAINISVNTSIGATFNKQMDPSSFHENSFRVWEDTAAVSGTVNCDDSTAVFIPSRNFAENTRITIRISADVADIEGNTMDNEYEWSFVTSDKSTAAGPTITATNPSDGASGIPVNSAVVATFSDTMDASTVNTATFLLSLESTNIAGNVEYSGRKTVFVPSGNLQKGQTYRATVTEDVRNREGYSLIEDYDWEFTTEEEDIDDTPPEVTANNPGDGANNVPVNTSVSATFSEQVDPATVSAETFILSENGSSVDGSVEYSNQTATFDPFSNLRDGTTYTARITTEVKDPAGNSLEQPHQWTFTTEDFTPPKVIETNPENDDDDVSRNVTITAEFSEPLDPATINDETVILERQRFFRGPRQVEAALSYADNVISIDPDSKLRKEEDYTVRLSTDITDVAGNALSSEYEWEFETEDD